MAKPPYLTTPLTMRLNTQIVGLKNPRAFAIANFGEGPLLTYYGYQCRVDTLAVHLIRSEQQLVLTHTTKPPYFLAAAQEEPNGSILLSVYQDEPEPILETEGDASVIGHIFAHSQSPSKTNQTLVQAIFLPQHAHMFAGISPRDSLVLEKQPELCAHLLTCSGLIEHLLKKVGD